MPITEILCQACGCTPTESECDHCGHPVCADCTTNVRGFEQCEWCAPELVAHCYDCGDSIYEDESFFFCDSCDERTCGFPCDCACPEGNESVHPWDYRPNRWSPKGDYPAAPLLGVELEVGGDVSDIVEAVQGIDDCEYHLYMKDDGSIDGVEIVSHPATLDWVNTWNRGESGRMRIGWLGLLDTLRSLPNTYVDSGYGLHVHVSRNAFRRNGKHSAAHTYAWMLFIYRNASYVQRFARRTESRWCQFSRGSRSSLVDKAKTEGAYSSDRYVAINTNNSRTFELRVFAATLDPVEFMAALEFVTASVEFTRTMTAYQALRDGLWWCEFERYVADRAELYPNLDHELARTSIDGGYDTSLHTFPRGKFSHTYQDDYYRTHRFGNSSIN